MKTVKIASVLMMIVLTGCQNMNNDRANLDPASERQVLQQNEQENEARF